MPRVTSPHVLRDVDSSSANGVSAQRTSLLPGRTLSQEEVDEQLFAEVEAEIGELAADDDKDLAALEADLADLMAQPEENAAPRAELPLLAPAEASSYSFDGTDVRREEKWVRKDGKFQKVNRDDHLEAQVEAELEQEVEEEERRLGDEAGPGEGDEEKPRWVRRAEQSAAGSSYTFDGSDVIKEAKAAPVHPSKQLSSEEDHDESSDEEIRALKREVAALEAEVDEEEDDEDAIAADLARISEDLAQMEAEERSEVDSDNIAQAKEATQKIATGAARQAATRQAAGPSGGRGRGRGGGGAEAAEEEAAKVVVFTAPAVSAEQTVAVPAAAAAAPAEGVPRVMPRPGRAAVDPGEVAAAPAALMTPQKVAAPTSAASPPAKDLTPDDGIAPWMREMQQLEQSIAIERSSHAAKPVGDVQPTRGPKQMKKMKSLRSPEEKQKQQPEPEPESEPEPAPAPAAAATVAAPMPSADVKYAHLAGTNPFDTPPRQKQQAQADAGSVPAVVSGGIPGGVGIPGGGGRGVAAPLSLQLAPPAQQLRSMTAAQLDAMTEKLAVASQWLGLSYPARAANVTSNDGAQTGSVAVNATGLSLSLRSRAAKPVGSTPTKEFKKEREVSWKHIRAWYVLPNGVAGDGEPQVLVQLVNHEELVITPLSAGGTGDSGARSATSLASVATAMAKEMAAASAEAARHYSDTKKAREMDPNSSFDGTRDMSMSIDWEDVSVISADGSSISTPTGAAVSGLPWPPEPAAGVPAEEGVPPAHHAPAAVALQQADQWPAGSAATATPPASAASAGGRIPGLSLAVSPSATGQAAPQFYRSLTILAEFEGHLSTALALQSAGAATAAASGDGGVVSFVSVAQEAAVALRGYQDELLALAAWTPRAGAGQAESKLLKLTGAAAKARADVARALEKDLTV